MTVKNWIPPTKQEIQEIISKQNLSTKKAAHLAKIGERTLKEWLDPNSTKSPSQSAWTIFCYEVRAINLGYKTLDDLISEKENAC